MTSFLTSKPQTSNIQQAGEKEQGQDMRLNNAACCNPSLHMFGLIRGVWPVCGGTGRGVWCSMVVTRQQAHYSHVQVRGCGQSVVALNSYK